ncbi:MAG: CDP-alcohol phosphatidyltransferase family protein [Rhodanobacteraceae bacterium]|nr:MAG: CDP-alcohol phosphatidyltransferase family protein [Rhodanobacteraceae bacterium]
MRAPTLPYAGHHELAKDVSGSIPAEATPLRHLPNLISALRIALVVPLLATILFTRYESALVIAAVAGVSDGVDGYLARRFRWQSRLGSILDPVADKLMLVGCMVVLGWLGEVPRWLVILVVARDAVIALGVLAWHRVLHNFEARPSWLSKTTTAVQIAFVLLVLADHAFGWNLQMRVPVLIVAVLTAASGLDYVLRWGRLARAELKHRNTSA